MTMELKYTSSESLPGGGEVEDVKVRSLRGVVEIEAPDEADTDEVLEIPVFADLEEGIIKSETFPMSVCGTKDGLHWALSVVNKAKFEFRDKLEEHGHEDLEIELSSGRYKS